jgi:hypothetical protein
MERRCVGSLGLVIAIIVISPPAQAGDRKSDGRGSQDSKAELFASSHKAHAVLVSRGSERPDPSSIKLFEDGDSILASKRLGGHEEKQTSGEAKREHKSLTLFRFDSKLGEIKVQPVFGKVTGAQFSLGF